MQKLLISDARYLGNDRHNVEYGIQLLFQCGIIPILFSGLHYRHAKRAAKTQHLSVKITLFVQHCTTPKQSLNYICSSKKQKKEVAFLLTHTNFDDSTALNFIVDNGYFKSKLLQDYLYALKKKPKNLTRYLKNMQIGTEILSYDTLALDGNNIKILLGITQSPRVGLIKKKLLMYTIAHPECNTKKQLIHFLKQKI